MSDPSRLAFVLEPFRIAEVVRVDVTGRHGEMARRDDEPIETHFDSLADALAVANERADLLSPERSLFQIRVRGLDDMLDLDLHGPQMPTARFVDTVRAIDRVFLATEVGYDFPKQQAQIMIWG